MEKHNSFKFLLMFLAILFLAIIPSVLGADYSFEGVKDSAKRVSGLFIAFASGLFSPDLLKNPDDVIGFLRFDFFFLLFIFMYIGVSRIPQMGKNHATIIALIISLFVFLIPRAALLALGQTYLAAIILLFPLLIVAGILFMAHKMPDTHIGNALKVLLCIFGIIVLWTAKNLFFRLAELIGQIPAV